MEIGPPGPAHKAPLFRWALLGMICPAVAAVGIVARAAVALGQRLEPNPSGVSESHTTTHLSIHIADPTIDTCLMALATGVCLIQYRAADRALVFPQGFTVSIGAPKP